MIKVYLTVMVLMFILFSVNRMNRFFSFSELMSKYISNYGYLSRNSETYGRIAYIGMAVIPAFILFNFIMPMVYLFKIFVSQTLNVKDSYIINYSSLNTLQFSLLLFVSLGTLAIMFLNTYELVKNKPVKTKYTQSIALYIIRKDLLKTYTHCVTDITSKLFVLTYNDFNNSELLFPKVVSVMCDIIMYAPNRAKLDSKNEIHSIFTSRKHSKTLMKTLELMQDLRSIEAMENTYEGLGIEVDKLYFENLCDCLDDINLILEK